MKTRHSRRDFIRLSAAGAVGALVISQFSCKPKVKKGVEAPDPKSFGVGLQLYTIRGCHGR